MSGSALSDDPSDLGNMIAEGESDGSLTSGGSIGNPAGDITARLMNTSPDPKLSDVELYRLGGWEDGLRYLKRGIGKFVGAGATAAEDLAMGTLNIMVGVYRGFTSAPDESGGVKPAPEYDPETQARQP